MSLLLLHGRACETLGKALAKILGTSVDRCRIEDFPDGEILVRVDAEVAGADAYLLQSTAAPTGRNLLELLLLSDACRRRGARRLTAILPYFGYARQDRRVRGDEPVGARLVTDLLACRFDRIIAVDLHNPAIEGFSTVPLVHLSAVPLLAEAFRPRRRQEHILVAPDAGAVSLARRYADMLQLPVAYVHKIRESGEDVTVRGVWGDLRDRAPVVVDDMVSTGGTLAETVKALLERGARPQVTAIVTHPLLAGRAEENLAGLPLEFLLTTDSVPLPTTSLPVEVVSLAPLLADRIADLHRT